MQFSSNNTHLKLLVYQTQKTNKIPHLFLCLVEGCECRVALLPQELPGPQEGLRVLELPPLS